MYSTNLYKNTGISLLVKHYNPVRSDIYSLANLKHKSKVTQKSKKVETAVTNCRSMQELLMQYLHHSN